VSPNVQLFGRVVCENRRGAGWRERERVGRGGEESIQGLDNARGETKGKVQHCGDHGQRGGTLKHGACADVVFSRRPMEESRRSENITRFQGWQRFRPKKNPRFELNAEKNQYQKNTMRVD